MLLKLNLIYPELALSSIATSVSSFDQIRIPAKSDNIFTVHCSTSDYQLIPLLFDIGPGGEGGVWERFYRIYFAFAAK